MAFSRHFAALAILACSPALVAATCGTFASPLTCSVTAGGNITYTASNFSLSNAAQSGGGSIYQASDVDIDASLSGTALVLRLSKHANTPTPGSSFAANTGQTSNFTLSYDVTISAAAPGTVAFVAPVTVDLFTSVALGTGFAQSQLNLSGFPTMTCTALRNNITVTPGACGLPLGVGLVLNASDIVLLSGGSGGAAMGAITNRFDATFTPSPGVPEPSSFALLGAGLVALAWRRTRVS